jgi:hypothetical protein
LGTSTTDDAKRYFSDMPLHRKPFRRLADGDRELIDMVRISQVAWFELTYFFGYRLSTKRRLTIERNGSDNFK